MDKIETLNLSEKELGEIADNQQLILERSIENSLKNKDVLDFSTYPQR